MTCASNRVYAPPILVDLGCEFPPFTAIDSAATLIGWLIIGVDPSFDRDLVYDDQSNYGT